nr:hypothetical protein [Saccharofermentans sp.]
DMPQAEQKVPETSEAFDPYGKQNSEELMDTPPLVFGDDANAAKAEQKPSENVEAIPVPDFELKEDKPELKEEDKLNVDFPAETPVEPAKADSEDQVPTAPADEVVLPFAEQVTAVSEPEEVKTDDVPDMPLYDGDNFDTPVNAVNSEEPISAQTDAAYAYGDYNNADQQPQVYQPYGSEAFPAEDQTAYGAYNNQDGGTNMSDNSGFTSFGDGNDGAYGGEYQTPYGDAPNAGYTDPYAEQPQPAAEEFTDPYAQTASASSSSKLDDDWFNNILGVDDSQQGGYAYPGADEQPAQPSSAQQAQYTNPGKTSYRPAGEGPSGATRRPDQARPRPQGSGNGGRGGGRKIKLNRNGYIFLAFVAIVIICLIILIAVIVKGCSKKDEPAESNASTSPVISESVMPTEPTAETTPTPVSDSAPIAYFNFSDYIGYRTWWDVFHYVYGIDIENNSDPRIATIITYNGLDPATYTGPNSGDRLLLPPEGVLSGEIDNTFTVVGGPVTDTQATDAAGNPISTETTAAGGVTGNIEVT